jgi:hypothetical protein
LISHIAPAAEALSIGVDSWPPLAGFYPMGREYWCVAKQQPELAERLLARGEHPLPIVWPQLCAVATQKKFRPSNSAWEQFF